MKRIWLASGSWSQPVLAGPTREALDPVRFLTNHPSGSMGYAIAGVAAGQGRQ
ncbi:MULTISPECIES: phosphopantothenoylcysteine decarboxylase domain-containing protein [unclassified Bilifractor]|uniref:phosphopantothenoylcysteine decarboxylase domain-containing protein n=1 Tax=unclassified Bilifractor TaxID=2815795 RepID=UPI003F91C63F